MTAIDLNVCTCDCHTMEGVAHIMPCCLVCDQCGLTIEYGAMEAHLRQHEEDAESW